MRTPHARGWVLHAGLYAACTLILLVVAAFMWFLTDRLLPVQAAAPPAVVVPFVVDERPMPDALWDAERAEAVYTRRWTR